MNSSKNTLFTIFLIFSLISFSFSTGCKYKKTKNGNEDYTNPDYLKEYDDEEDKKKQACFSLSFSEVFMIKKKMNVLIKQKVKVII